MSNKNIYQVRINFVTPILGTMPQRDIAVEHLLAKARRNGALDEEDETTMLEEEALSIPEQLERGTTAFHRINDKPVFYDYQIKGFLKEAARVYNGKPEIGGIKNARNKVESYVFVFPRVIPINYTGEITYLERPLRADVPPQPRVAIARSEMIDAGAQIEFEIHVLDPQTFTEKVIRALLSYGEYKGIGQWRNGGYGRFTFVLQKVS